MTSAPLPPVAILAGGLATRLRPLTERIPKSLVPVAGRPFLAHQLDLLRSQGIRRAVLCVGHLGDQIEAAFGDGRAFGIELAYAYDGPSLAGTAGALRRALPLLGPEFFTLYGDSYLEIDYAEAWSAYRRQSASALMTVIAHALATEPANAWYEAGLIRAYDKQTPRPEMRHVDYGLGLFRADVVAGAPEIADLSDLQTRLAREGRLAGHEVTRRYFEIGSPRGLADLESHLQERP
jgi:NDP-sugar pyrophosphorylase family protein